MTAPAVERVVLPYKYQLRSYARAVLDAFRQGLRRRFLLLWHRRASKSSTAVQVVVMAAVEMVGVYWIICPQVNIGRRNFWDGLSHDGRRLLLGYIPPSLIQSVSENEMQVVLVNGSVIQIVGADEPDRLARGPGLRGIVLDEFAVFPSAYAWHVLQPILMENDGWAIFCFTPLGRNHAHALYETVRQHPEEWYVSRLTVDDTRRDAEGEDGSPVVSPAQIEKARRDGMPEDMIQQECYLSFVASVPGAYYAKELAKCEAEGRIDLIPWTPTERVHTVMDLGIADSTVLVFFQVIPLSGAIHVLDCYAARGEATAHYVQVLQQRQRERGWTWGRHFAPHDVTQRHDAGGALVSRFDQWGAHGVKLTVLERTEIAPGIQAARMLFPRCRFNRDPCRALLDALARYASEWSEERQVLALRPRHDSASDFADSFRYLGQAVQLVERDNRRGPRDRRETPRHRADTATWSPFDRTFGRGAR